MAESILIVFFHLCLGSPNGLFHLGFEKNFMFLSVVRLHDNEVILCFVWPQNLTVNTHCSRKENVWIQKRSSVWETAHCFVIIT
jgi:hypothetical protein